MCGLGRVVRQVGPGAHAPSVMDALPLRLSVLRPCDTVFAFRLATIASVSHVSTTRVGHECADVAACLAPWTILPSGSGRNNLSTARCGCCASCGDHLSDFGPNHDGFAAASCPTVAPNGPACHCTDVAASMTIAEKPATKAGRRAREAPYTHCTRGCRKELVHNFRVEPRACCAGAGWVLFRSLVCALVSGGGSLTKPT
ncbi:hypothetical protein LXA43DRAFT_671146 [Ganoderma leucocontextum]|nr:hypothetical protein LXA43DRAFT_671146 [Ganoderma leucocontextum]